MLKVVILLAFLFCSFFLVPQTFAKSNHFISIVNPVRGTDFWELKDEQIQDAVLGQAQILKKFNLEATWLIRYDALNDQKVLSAIADADEKGLFLEVTPTWTKVGGVNYHQSESWHVAGSAFLTGYEREEREQLIDIAFNKFKQVFNNYPKSVGAWWIDSYSLSYMQEKYGITTALIVADQYTTDNYQIWGQYFSTPYYPSKNNALHPAQSLENKLPVVITQWAARDPVNAYGNGVFESTFSIQANDYIDYHNLDTKYFSSLLDLYNNQPLNKFSHLVVGLENSYSWNKYKDEYQNQVKILAEKSKTGQFSAVTLQDFASWYMQNFPNLSPEQIIVADDPLGTFKKVVWFMDPYYRAGWFFNQDGSVFRDIRQYIDGQEELCFQKRCDEVNFATSTTRVLDEVSFGHKYILDEGKINNFKVTKTENFVITYANEAGKKRLIEFLPRDIAVDGKISSIDTIILESTKKDVTKIQDSQIEKGFFEWSAAGILLKSIKFILFLILAVLIPGIVLTKRANIFLSTAVGLTFLTVVFYLASLLKVKWLVLLYILVTLILFLRLRLLTKLQIPKLNKFNLPALGLILLGTIFQVMPTFRSGLIYPYGMGLWGPNTHDGLWHISLINQLVKTVPPQNPVFAGTILKNYHYFYDLLIAATNFLAQIPIVDLVFRFYPLLFSLLLGVGTYYLMTNLFKNTLATLFSLYLVYFAGSFGWIVEYIKFKHLGGESAFWSNQSISFNLNPPFAISLLMVIAIWQLVPHVKSKISIIVLTILCGTLVAFKSYAAVLVLLTLLLVGIIKTNKQYLLVFLLSSLVSASLFISNFSFGQQLILFSPFWFIHSMIDSPDRVGWVRLSLARATGWEQGNWFKFITAEVISLTIFILGNLGTRVFALLALLKIKYIVRQPLFLFIFTLAILSFTIPILFIQAGNPWNTIQFLYYGLYIAAVVTGAVLARILLRFNRSFAIAGILIILVITPINSWATANGYLSYQPHALISKKELQALKFLSSLDDGIILTYPYDEKLKKGLAEPWPILAYDSTAYVSALSGKAVYLEDEPQNQILLTDYKKRLVASKGFFATQDFNFLTQNNIQYIYLPKVYDIHLSENKLKKIYDNEEVNIYQVNNEN